MCFTFLHLVTQSSENTCRTLATLKKNMWHLFVLSAVVYVYPNKPSTVAFLKMCNWIAGGFEKQEAVHNKGLTYMLIYLYLLLVHVMRYSNVQRTTLSSVSAIYCGSLPWPCTTSYVYRILKRMLFMWAGSYHCEIYTGEFMLNLTFGSYRCCDNRLSASKETLQTNINCNVNPEYDY